MPVQFVCSACRQLLSVGRKKIGALVPCPRCGVSNVVPDEATAAEAVAQLRATRGGELMELVVYDDDPELPPGAAPMRPPAYSASLPPAASGAPPAALAPQPAAASWIPASAPQPQPATSYAWQRAADYASIPPGKRMLLVSRNAIYAQAALFVLLGVVTFATGYMMGRRGIFSSTEGTSAADSAQPIGVHGAVQYTEGNKTLPDAEAVVIALPAGKHPEQKFPARGLRVGDPADDIATAAARALNATGGDSVRAAANGDFNFVVRGPGSYHVLIVSAHATRPRDAAIPPADVDVLAPYFQSAAEVIGSHRYWLSTLDIAEAPAPITYTFE